MNGQAGGARSRSQLFRGGSLGWPGIAWSLTDIAVGGSVAKPTETVAGIRRRLEAYDRIAGPLT